MTTAGDRLKAARVAAGYQTAADAARALGEHPQNVRDHEADRRRFNSEQAARYGRAFKVDPASLLFGDGHTTDSGVTDIEGVRMVGIIGEIRAGNFAPIPDDDPVPSEFVPVSLPEYVRAHLYGLLVVGRSMDLHYPDGSAVIVCPTHEAGIREGDHVVVRVRKGSMAETTLKEIRVDADGIALWPRSTDAAYQTPIRLRAQREADEGPEIIGVVVGHFASRSARAGPLITV